MCLQQNKNLKTVYQDPYEDEDSAEEADTKYVLEQMNKSQEHLNNKHNSKANNTDKYP